MCDTKASKPDPVGSDIRLDLHLPRGLYAQVQAYAGTHHIRRSEALRYLVEAGLAAEARAMLDGADAEYRLAMEQDA